MVLSNGGPSSDTEILVRSGTNDWTAPTTSAFTSENELQRLIHKQPTLIPGIAHDAVAVIELQSGAGPADLCIVDTSGEITLVECKLASNAEVRRKIVGQVLDYASQIWQMTFHDFDGRWRQRNEGVGIIEALGDETGELASTLSRNLAEGRFDLVLAVDRINDELRRIIEYLNHITRSETSVTAFELRYAKHAGVEILVPAVYGAEIAAAKSRIAGEKQPRWTPSDVISWLEENEPDSAPLVTQLFELSEHDGLSVEGTSAQTPSALIGRDVSGGKVWPYVLYTASSGPTISINFQWLKEATSESREAFLENLAGKYEEIDSEGVRAADFSKRPRFKLAEIGQFLSASDLISAANLLV